MKKEMDKYICEICNKEYSNRGGLKKHKSECNIFGENCSIDGRLKKWFYFFNVHFELLEKVCGKE